MGSRNAVLSKPRTLDRKFRTHGALSRSQYRARSQPQLSTEALKHSSSRCVKQTTTTHIKSLRPR